MRGEGGGRAITSGSIQTGEGGILACVHVKRLSRLAERANEKDRATLLAAIEAIRALSKKNRILGGRIGGMAKHGDFRARGVVLTDEVPAVAEAIMRLAADGTVIAYRWRSRRAVRVVPHGSVPANGVLVGTYDDFADFRQVQEDLIAAGYTGPRKFKDCESCGKESGVFRKILNNSGKRWTTKICDQCVREKQRSGWIIEALHQP